jgi:hypothetical protein
MPRKKVQTASNASARQANSNAQPKRGEKTQAIKDLYAKGITQAPAMDAALKEIGMSVSKPVIYQTLNKLKGGNGKKRGGKRKGRAAAATAPAAPAARRPASTGLVASDLHELMAITEKAGGVDVVVGLLQNMKQLQ